MFCLCFLFSYIGRVQYYYVELFIIYKLYKLKVEKLIRNMIVYVFINLRSDLKNSRFLDSEKLSVFSFVKQEDFDLNFQPMTPMIQRFHSHSMTNPSTVKNQFEITSNLT